MLYQLHLISIRIQPVKLYQAWVFEPQTSDMYCRCNAKIG